MNIKEELLREHSRKQAMKIASYASSDKKHFEELMNLFLGNTYRITQRAAWAVNICGEKHPQLILPWLPKMISFLEKDVHDAVKRNTLRLLQFIIIPKKLYGRITDVCFRFLQSKEEPLAIKVFAMKTLATICTDEPELINELRMIIEDQLPNATPGFKVAARDVFKKLSSYTK